MENDDTDDWKPGQKKREESKSRIKATLYAGLFGVFCIAGGAGAGFLALMHFYSPEPEKVSQVDPNRDELNQIQRNLVSALNRLTVLERKNGRLIEEIHLLTGRGGVLSGMITQMRNLKGENEVLRRDLFGGTGPGIGAPRGARPQTGEMLTNVGMSGQHIRRDGPRARHAVVTPKRQEAIPGLVAEPEEGEQAED